MAGTPLPPESVWEMLCVCVYCHEPIDGGPGGYWSKKTLFEVCAHSPTGFHEASGLDPLARRSVSATGGIGLGMSMLSDES